LSKLRLLVEGVESTPS